MAHACVCRPALEQAQPTATESPPLAHCPTAAISTCARLAHGFLAGSGTATTTAPSGPAPIERNRSFCRPMHLPEAACALPRFHAACASFCASAIVLPSWLLWHRPTCPVQEELQLRKCALHELRRSSDSAQKSSHRGTRTQERAWYVINIMSLSALQDFIQWRAYKLDYPPSTPTAASPDVLPGFPRTGLSVAQFPHTVSFAGWLSYPVFISQESRRCANRR